MCVCMYVYVCMLQMKVMQKELAERTTQSDRLMRLFESMREAKVCVSMDGWMDIYIERDL